MKHAAVSVQEVSEGSCTSPEILQFSAGKTDQLWAEGIQLMQRVEV